MTDLDVAALPRIDVEEEIAKVLGGQLLGAWQLPAELVRLAARRATARIDVQLAKDSVRVRWDGPTLDPAVLASLGQLLDSSVSPVERHRALLRVEAAGDPALLILAALRPRQLAIGPQGGQAGLRLRAGRAAPSAGAAVPAQDASITAQLAFDARRARDHVRSVTRFARVEILLDGRRIAPQGRSALAETAIDDDLPSRLWLTERGDTARCHLLVDQVVAAEVTSAGAPPFEACLELRPALASAWSAAALREIGVSRWPRMQERAFALALRLGLDLAALPATAQRSVRRGLLLAARERGELRPLMDLPLFCARGRRQARVVWRTLGELAGQRRGLQALSPNQRPEDFLLGGDEAILVDAEERALLASLIGLIFTSPRPRLVAARGLRARVAAGLGALWTCLRAPFHGRGLPETALSAEERIFLGLLREQLAGQIMEVQLTTGRGRVARRGRERPVLLLPRANPDVVRCRQALLADPAWAYPVALVLLGGSPLSIEHRSAWSRRGGEG